MQLGDYAKDRISGFEGTITGIVNYITGCRQVLLGPKTAPDGAMRDSHWFDEQRVQVITPMAIVLDNSQTPGPDKAAPRR